MRNNNERGVLLASFFSPTSEEKILEEVQHIADSRQLANKYIFLFSQVDDPSKKILTYNAIIQKGTALNSRLFTMRVHRKKQTNTLYTINALNRAVAQDNDGQTGRHLKLEWEKYRESILLTSRNELVVHAIKVEKIFEIEEPPTDDPSDE